MLSVTLNAFHTFFPSHISCGVDTVIDRMWAKQPTILHTQVSDHLGVSALTGKTRVNPPPSSILSHLSETGHTASH